MLSHNHNHISRLSFPVRKVGVIKWTREGISHSLCTAATPKELRAVRRKLRLPNYRRARDIGCAGFSKCGVLDLSTYRP